MRAKVLPLITLTAILTSCDAFETTRAMVLAESTPADDIPQLKPTAVFNPSTQLSMLPIGVMAGPKCDRPQPKASKYFKPGPNLHPNLVHLEMEAQFSATNRSALLQTMQALHKKIRSTDGVTSVHAAIPSEASELALFPDGEWFSFSMIIWASDGMKKGIIDTIVRTSDDYYNAHPDPALHFHIMPAQPIMAATGEPVEPVAKPTAGRGTGLPED